MRHLHSILGFLRVLAAGAVLHAGRAAGDQGQVVRVHPSPAAARRRARQRQQTHDRRVLIN